MRGPFLALVILTASLSGCILGPSPAPADEPAPQAGWRTLTAPDPLPGVRALGIWVPEGATGLRLSTAAAGAAAGETDAPLTLPTPPTPRRDKSHGDTGPTGILSLFDDRVLLIMPDGTWAYSGRPLLPDASATPSTTPGAPTTTTAPTTTAPTTTAPTTTTPAPGGLAWTQAAHLPYPAARPAAFSASTTTTTPPSAAYGLLPNLVLLELSAPAAGLWKLVLFGDAPLPLVQVHAPADTALAPMAPLPLNLDRVPLFGSADPSAVAPLEAAGTLSAPPGTVLVWGELVGLGADARLAIQTASGYDVAHHRAYAMTSPGGLTLFPFGGFLQGDQVDPEPLAERELIFEARGQGSGLGLAHLAIVGDAPAPWSAPDAHADGPMETLGGSVAPGSASWFIMPADATAEILVEEGSQYDDHADYRLYDAAGTRLAWGRTDTNGVTSPLPAGPLVLVNDGPGVLNVALHGALPADASLHKIEASRRTVTVDLGTDSGYQEAVKSVRLSGPVLGLGATPMLASARLMVTIEDPQGRPLATAPASHEMFPGGAYCCELLFFGPYAEYTHWVDGGDLRLRVEAADAYGEVDVRLNVVDLGQVGVASDDD